MVGRFVEVFNKKAVKRKNSLAKLPKPYSNQYVAYQKKSRLHARTCHLNRCSYGYLEPFSD